MSAPNRRNGKTNEAWDKMCTSKTRYSEEFSARAGAFHLFEVGEKHRDAEMYVYQCPNCRGWHMTGKRNHLPAITFFGMWGETEETVKTTA
jgi:hypothetical protein